jgi:acyl carrier protein
MKPELVVTVIRDFVHDLHPDESGTQLPAGATFDALGIDSMSLVDLLFTLEREFDVAIPDEALPRLATVGDLVEFITAESTQLTPHLGHP